MSKPFPIEATTRCELCGVENHAHYRNQRCRSFLPPEDLPEPHECVPALAVTSWTCRTCGYEQDVWGEGAIESWMDCQNPECGVPSYLDFTLGIHEALGINPQTAGAGDR